jgi:hypothetical protein
MRPALNCSRNWGAELLQLAVGGHVGMSGNSGAGYVCLAFSHNPGPSPLSGPLFHFFVLRYTSVLQLDAVGAALQCSVLHTRSDVHGWCCVQTLNSNA